MSEKAKEVVFLVGVYVAMLGGMMAKAIFDHMTSGSDLELRQFIIPLIGIADGVRACVQGSEGLRRDGPYVDIRVSEWLLLAGYFRPIGTFVTVQKQVIPRLD